MPGKGSPAGPARYPECATGRCKDRHHAERTVPCAAGRAHNSQRTAAYRKTRILRGKLKQPSLGSQRRIRALARLGWPQTALEQLGKLPPKTLSQTMLRAEITVQRAAEIDRLYRRLAWEGAGPDKRTRMIAASRGWPGPLDWDNIDDPGEIPRCVIESAHVEALGMHREYKKMISKRQRRAGMSAAERSAAQAAERERRRLTQEQAEETQAA